MGESKIHRQRDRESIAGAIWEFRARVMGKITNGAELVGLGIG